MARSRNIKPSFFQNEDLAELDPLARLLFIGLWTEADYKGCIEYRPKRLKVRLLPYDECDTEALVNNLERSGFVVTYSVSGQRYLKVVNFEKHQNPHKNERETGSEIPDIDKSEAQPIDSAALTKTPEENGTDRESDGTAPADSLLPQPDSLNPITDTPTPDSTGGDKSPKRGKRAEDFDAVGFLVGKGVTEKVAKDWLALRKTKKLAPTETAFAGVEREAEKAGLSLQDTIELCCLRGWGGFEAKWCERERPAGGRRQMRIPMNNIGVDDAIPEGFSDGFR